MSAYLREPFDCCRRDAKAITAYLGHASIQTTFDLYGHLMPGNEEEAVALVNAYLE
jgi:integrase